MFPVGATTNKAAVNPCRVCVCRLCVPTLWGRHPAVQLRVVCEFSSLRNSPAISWSGCPAAHSHHGKYPTPVLTGESSPLWGLIPAGAGCFPFRSLLSGCPHRNGETAPQGAGRNDHKLSRHLPFARLTRWTGMTDRRCGVFEPASQQPPPCTPSRCGEYMIRQPSRTLGAVYKLLSRSAVSACPLRT